MAGYVPQQNDFTRSGTALYNPNKRSSAELKTWMDAYGTQQDLDYLRGYRGHDAIWDTYSIPARTPSPAPVSTPASPAAQPQVVQEQGPPRKRSWQEVTGGILGRLLAVPVGAAYGAVEGMHQGLSGYGSNRQMNDFQSMMRMYADELNRIRDNSKPQLTALPVGFEYYIDSDNVVKTRRKQQEQGNVPQ